MAAILVIGGGAAGFFAAIHAAHKNNKVVIFEKSGKVLSKVKVSGGGRCNVTNTLTEISLLIANYPRGRKELRNVFSRFSTLDTVNWFESRGVKLKTEPDGRMFPVTDSSQTIIDCLLSEIHQKGISLNLNTSVKEINFENSKFNVLTESEMNYVFDKIIVATGGFPQLKSYQWLSFSGHIIIPPVPSLFTFNIPKNPFDGLMGVSVPLVRIRIEGFNEISEGPMLFTHWGLSGPAVLKMSSLAARYLSEKQYEFRVGINFIPTMNEEQIRQLLLSNKVILKEKKIINSVIVALPSRLWERLVELSGISKELKWGEVSNTLFNKLASNISNSLIEVKGKTTFKEEFVTCGGVALKEINMSTMESKLLPGLYFAGEILDIDGVTGGFNFQAAWSTGFIAGTIAGS
ncbi:MAG: NAD(P)/FAD-dependent oxidoreductase [Bacteroidia bacterium]|nr:NAD(P)/FAD-dependent oxidoreductase [Bacteroidia bacterium]